MDKNVEKSVYEILETIGEALEHLQDTENEQLRQLVKTGRQNVTATLENALSCSLEQRIQVTSLSDEDWLCTAHRIMREISDPFRPDNAVDREFQALLNYFWSHSSQELIQTMLNHLQIIKQQSQEVYEQYVTYFARFPLWGSLDPESGDYNTLELRAAVLKQHSYDLLWLYRRMEDYLSKHCLYAVLNNWALLDLVELQKTKSIFPDYWEPDIFPNNEGDVLVDVGAYIGDSIEQYVKMYGYGYKKIYAYEISSDSYHALCKNVARMKLHDVVTRRKGAGRERGKMFVGSSSTDASANQLNRSGNAKAQVEVVPLDEDVEETITFLKMDIEGAEQDALLGCERIIRSQHPKLAICTYHGYEDIWKIPCIIDRMCPEYRFYMRYYGGNLFPTEYVLLCKYHVADFSCKNSKRFSI